jgi:hypothetical protein
MATAIETVKSNREEASEFLTALFGRYFQDNDGWVELRFIPPTAEGRPAQAWWRQGKLTDENWTDLKQLNQSAHVFMGVNPRNVQSGCAVDIDGKDEGKEAALKRASEFPIQPSILVDSGHGYHCYWLLKKPLLEITDEVRLEVRQILKGLSKSPLKSDGARIDISSCLRLPGTWNVKSGTEPVRCGIVYCHPDTLFALSDFAAYRDTSFREPEASDEELPQFGEKDLIVSLESEAKAFESVDLLQVPTRTKTMILTGKAKGMKDNSNSGRDFSIICTLVMAGYGYPTIRSVFLNPHLKCANRIAEKGEGDLKWDVKKAVKFYEKFKVEGTPQSRQILAIK